MIQTIEPRSPEEIMDEVESRTARGSGFNELYLSLRTIGRAGLLITTLSLVLIFFLRVFQNAEELAFLGGVANPTLLAFSYPGTSLILNSFFLLVFYLILTRAEENMAYSSLYYESVEGLFLSLLHQLAHFVELRPMATDEEMDAEAVRLEEAAMSKIALREAEGMCLTKALMWEFPPESMLGQERDYLRNLDITSRGYFWYQYFVALAGFWVLMSQINLLALLLPLQAFFLAR